MTPGEQPLVHTDQGFPYQHRARRRLLAETGAASSLSRKGNCLDNAVIESFCEHLKAEFFAGARFPSIEALHAYVRFPGDALVIRLASAPVADS